MIPRCASCALPHVRAWTTDGAALKDTPLNGPRTIALDSPGNLYLALREGNAIYRVDADAGRFTMSPGPASWATRATAVQARLGWPLTGNEAITRP